MNKIIQSILIKKNKRYKNLIVLPVIGIMAGGSLHSQTPLLNSIVTKTVIDSLISQVNKYYVFKDAALKINEQLKKRYEEGIYNRIDDPYLLADQLTSDVHEAQNDAHFHVEYNPQLANEVSGNIDDVPRMVAAKLEEEKAKNYGFKKAEILAGNIGYLELSSFSRLNKYSKITADATLKMLSGARALIIDLRYGKGGSPDMVNFIASHFFKTKTHIADIYIRSENSTLPYWTTPDTSYRALAAMPVYILTSYRTFSAAEGLAYCLQRNKRALIIGETTRGGAHTVTYKPLSNGFVCDIPFGRVLDPATKQNWETTGITPDIKADAETALETAETKIFEAAIAAATDSATLNNLKWQARITQAVNHPFQPDTASLKKLAGTYFKTQVVFEKGFLYISKPGLPKLKLLGVSNGVFRPMGNDSFMVDFNVEGNTGSGLYIKNDDGRIEYMALSKN